MRVPIVLFTVAALAACGDDPFNIDWKENPREATLFSLDRPETNRPTAFDLRPGVPIVVERLSAEGRWDFAVDRQGGQLVLLPPRALGVTSAAGVVPIPDADWDDVRQAPADTALYGAADPVPAEVGTVYVVRTHRQTDPFGRSCFFYGKVQVLDTDHEEGRLHFLHDRNPGCGDRWLVPRD